MTAPKRIRRAGGRWRLLVHGVHGPDRQTGGAAHNVYSHQRDADRHAKGRARLGDYPTKSEETVTVLAGTEFDELVVGRWMHVEQMDTGFWWMAIGGVTVHVRADRDGRPTHVTVHGPGDWDEPVEGCGYDLHWTEGGGS